jgi:1,4-dihydroxy-2-naphthoyl-CoA hydrolase
VRAPVTLLDRINAHPLPFAQLLGVEFSSAEPDAVTARMVVRPNLCTLGGFAHGGAIMSLADSLGGAAAFVNLPDGAKGTTTLESKTNFVAGAPSGSTLVGRCVSVHRGRRTQVWQTRIETEDGRLIALVTQTQMTL